MQTRARAWPLLLGVRKTADSYEDHKAGTHRDSSVVDVDVQRSLWAWTDGELSQGHAILHGLQQMATSMTTLQAGQTRSVWKSERICVLC